MNHLLLKTHKQPKMKLKISKEAKVCDIVSQPDSDFSNSHKQFKIETEIFWWSKPCRSLKDLTENWTGQPKFKVKMWQMITFKMVTEEMA